VPFSRGTRKMHLALLCGPGKATAIWSFRHRKPAACILGLTAADARLIPEVRISPMIPSPDRRLSRPRLDRGGSGSRLGGGNAAAAPGQLQRLPQVVGEREGEDLGAADPSVSAALPLAISALVPVLCSRNHSVTQKHNHQESCPSEALPNTEEVLRLTGVWQKEDLGSRGALRSLLTKACSILMTAVPSV